MYMWRSTRFSLLAMFISTRTHRYFISLFENLDVQINHMVESGTKRCIRWHRIASIELITSLGSIKNNFGWERTMCQMLSELNPIDIIILCNLFSLVSFERIESDQVGFRCKAQWEEDEWCFSDEFQYGILYIIWEDGKLLLIEMQIECDCIEFATIFKCANIFKFSLNECAELHRNHHPRSNFNYKYCAKEAHR